MTEHYLIYLRIYALATAELLHDTNLSTASTIAQSKDINHVAAMALALEDSTSPDGELRTYMSFQKEMSNLLAAKTVDA